MLYKETFNFPKTYDEKWKFNFSKKAVDIVNIDIVCILTIR